MSGVRKILFCMAIGATISCLMPPWVVRHKGGAVDAGYHFIANPPKRGSNSASIDLSRLLVQCIAIGLLGGAGILALSFKSRRELTVANVSEDTKDKVMINEVLEVPESSQPHFDFEGGGPWRRFWARFIDTNIHIGAMMLVAELSRPGTTSEVGPLLLIIICLPVSILIESILLGFFGTTAGKFLLSIYLIDKTGKKAPVLKCMIRSLKVWAIGLGFGIPLLWLGTAAYAAGRIRRHGAAYWDDSSQLKVCYLPLSGLRTTVATLLVVAFFSFSIAAKAGTSSDLFKRKEEAPPPAAEQAAPSSPIFFDLVGARHAGYSDAEITDHLGSLAGFDTESARKAGYSDREIINLLCIPKRKLKPNIRVPEGYRLELSNF